MISGLISQPNSSLRIAGYCSLETPLLSCHCRSLDRGPWMRLLSHAVLGDPVRIVSEYQVQSDRHRTLCHKIVRSHCFKGRKLRPILSKCFYISSSYCLLVASYIKDLTFIFRSVDTSFITVDLITAHGLIISKPIVSIICVVTGCMLSLD